jgi:hypothetical protein
VLGADWAIGNAAADTGKLAALPNRSRLKPLQQKRRNQCKLTMEQP